MYTTYIPLKVLAFWGFYMSYATDPTYYQNQVNSYWLWNETEGNRYEPLRISGPGPMEGEWTCLTQGPGFLKKKRNGYGAVLGYLGKQKKETGLNIFQKHI